jgi:hypothetical protein
VNRLVRSHRPRAPRAPGRPRVRLVLAAAVAPVAVVAPLRFSRARRRQILQPNASDWLNPANWNPAGVPGAADSALIIGGTPT